MEEATAPGFSSDSLGEVRQLLLVSPELLSQVWPHVEPLLLEAKETWGEYYTIESILLLLQAGRAQLWTMNDRDEFILAMVTELLLFPKKKVLNILLIAGSEFREGLELFVDCVEMWAWKQGVTKSTAVGRKGLLRLLKPYGYSERVVALEKDISGMVEH